MLLVVKTVCIYSRRKKTLMVCLVFPCARNNIFQMEVTHTAQLVTGLAFFAQGIAWTDCCHQSHSFAHHDQQLHSMNIQPKWGLSAYNSVVLARLLLPICLPGASPVRKKEAQPFLVFLVPPALNDLLILLIHFVNFWDSFGSTTQLTGSESLKNESCSLHRAPPRWHLSSTTHSVVGLARGLRALFCMRWQRVLS